MWETKFRGRAVGGKSWPNDRFGRVFFQPFYAGQTFGLGQLNPLTALAVNDMVVRVSHLPRLKAERAPEVYQAIMDPDSTLQYMAAVIRTAIDSYAEIAGMDISGNPGITATLYNLGDVEGPSGRTEAPQRRQGQAGTAAGELLRLAGQRQDRRVAGADELIGAGGFRNLAVQFHLSPSADLIGLSRSPMGWMGRLNRPME